MLCACTTTVEYFIVHGYLYRLSFHIVNIIERKVTNSSQVHYFWLITNIQNFTSIIFCRNLLSINEDRVAVKFNFFMNIIHVLWCRLAVVCEFTVWLWAVPGSINPWCVKQTTDLPAATRTQPCHMGYGEIKFPHQLYGPISPVWK